MKYCSISGCFERGNNHVVVDWNGIKFELDVCNFHKQKIDSVIDLY